jgi:hypothetical protein
VYLKQNADGLQCGVHFLPTANPALNDEIERTLARFLMAEQRRKRWLRDQQQKRRIS